MSLRWALACVTQGSFELKKVKRPPLQKGVMSKGVEELKPFCVETEEEVRLEPHIDMQNF